jgi:hypothetical protein
MRVVTCNDNGTLAVVREGKLDIYTLIGEADTPEDNKKGSIYTLLHAIGEDDNQARIYEWFRAL